jgi:hypothetical protein
MVQEQKTTNTYTGRRQSDTEFVLALITSAFVGGVAGYLGSLLLSKRMALVAARTQELLRLL